MNPLSLYLHVPFCSVRCSYCAFNVYIHLDHLIEPFVEALIREIEIVAQTNPGHQVHTIYFGGGTPTLLSAAQFERIISTIYEHFDVTNDAEVSTEANPNDLLDITFVRDLRKLGLSRLSIGVQSAVQRELELFGRLHDAQTVVRSVDIARQAGFDSLNLDLIYGTPQQTLADWDASLDAVIELQPEHLSLYALGLEPNTAMDHWVQNGKLPEPDDELAADMYDVATQRLAEGGYGQYEISNWSLPGHESLHNIQYWRNLPYLGLGPGAHGYAGGVRYHTIRSPHRYIEALTQDAAAADTHFPLTPAVAEHTVVSRDDEIFETIMMGLRLLDEGIDLGGFEQRFGVSITDIRQEAIAYHREHGYLELSENRLRLTPKGRLVSNRVLRDLV